MSACFQSMTAGVDVWTSSEGENEVLKAHWHTQAIY